MKISVVTGFLGLGLVRNQSADQVEKRVAVGDEALHELLRRSRQSGSLALQFGEHLGGERLKLASPLADIFSGYRFGSKVGIIGAPLSQSSMHLGSTNPELARQRKEKHVRIGQV